MKKTKTEAEQLAAIRHKPIDGRTVDEWDKDWKPLPDWRHADTRELRTHCGLIRFRRGSEIMYISSASEERGFHKRFRDLLRPGISGRDHPGGHKVHEHQDQLEAEILITGSSGVLPIAITLLKTAMILLHDPEWNRSQAEIEAAIRDQRKHAA